MKDICNKCLSVVKLYQNKEDVNFMACCGKSLVDTGTIYEPRVIKENTGPMLEIETPFWCPTKRGIVKEYIKQEELDKQKPTLFLPQPQSKTNTKEYMTYSEKRKKLMEFPKRLSWNEIEENGVYVIPKILSQSRKVIRVIFKNNYCIRYSEINEHGEESKVLSSIYPQDIDAIFITKILNY